MEGKDFTDVESLRDFLCDFHDEKQHKEQEALVLARQKFVWLLEGRMVKKVKSKLDARTIPQHVKDGCTLTPKENHSLPKREGSSAPGFWSSVFKDVR